MRKLKIKMLFIISGLVTALFLMSGNASADFITVDTNSFANANYDNDYMIGIYGNNSRPTSPLGGVPFNIPSSGNNFYLFTGKNSSTPEILTLNLSESNVSKAYLLLNTNWGVSGFKTGTITFHTTTESFTIDLINGINIRDWNNNNGSYANSTTDPNSQEVYSVYPNRLNSTGRIDMLTIPLPASFLKDTLTSIEIADFGWDGYSHIRLAGITLETIVPGTISGFVTDPNHLPIQGAKVILRMAGTVIDRTRTDANGYYEFIDLAYGKYIIIGKKFGYNRDRKVGKVMGKSWAKDEFINLILTPIP